jgi:hypothetical protein
MGPDKLKVAKYIDYINHRPIRFKLNISRLIQSNDTFRARDLLLDLM